MLEYIEECISTQTITEGLAETVRNEIESKGSYFKFSDIQKHLSEEKFHTINLI